MSYDNGGFRESDLQSLAIQREMGLENTIEELRKEIDSLKKQISARDILIKSLKSDYVLKKELEIRNLEEANRRLKDDIKKLLKQLEDQSTIEAGEKAILDRIYKYIEIVDRGDASFTQLYQLDFIPSHYRMIIDKTVKDYLVSKGVKDNSEEKAKIFFATSKPPHITENDTGIWRRVCFIPNEECWKTGNYTDGCDCELCMHKHKCSGYDKEDKE